MAPRRDSCAQHLTHTQLAAGSCCTCRLTSYPTPKLKEREALFSVCPTPPLPPPAPPPIHPPLLPPSHRQVKENFERFISSKNTIDDIYAKLQKAEAEGEMGVDGASSSEVMAAVLQVGAGVGVQGWCVGERGLGHGGWGTHTGCMSRRERKAGRSWRVRVGAHHFLPWDAEPSMQSQCSLSRSATRRPSSSAAGARRGAASFWGAAGPAVQGGAHQVGAGHHPALRGGGAAAVAGAGACRGA